MRVRGRGRGKGRGEGWRREGEREGKESFRVHYITSMFRTLTQPTKRVPIKNAPTTILVALSYSTARWKWVEGYSNATIIIYLSNGFVSQVAKHFSDFLVGFELDERAEAQPLLEAGGVLI